jgi:hypothetical protein
VSDPVRFGGRAATPDGGTIVWSVAEGPRGRRWREAIVHGGSLRRSLLLEVSPAGAPTRLEVTGAAGLLTLHPDIDGRELHGNVVTPSGIRHLRFDWSFEHELFVVGSPAVATVALRRFADILAVGEGRPVPVVWSDDALEPRPGAWQVMRTGPDAWELRDLDGTETSAVRIDEDGLPILPAAVRWPLEMA